MHLLLLETFPMHMPNGTPELCDSWNLLGKLVGREGFQAPVWLYAHLGSKGKNSGPRGWQVWDCENHNPRGLPYKPYHVLLSFSDHTTSSLPY